MLIICAKQYTKHFTITFYLIQLPMRQILYSRFIREELKLNDLFKFTQLMSGRVKTTNQIFLALLLEHLTPLLAYLQRN